jgi:hypothetical protein
MNGRSSRPIRRLQSVQQVRRNILLISSHLGSKQIPVGHGGVDYGIW